MTSLNRLARSTRDLLNILDALNRKGAAFRSLRDAWADTTTPHGRLMLTVLGGLAEFESFEFAKRWYDSEADRRVRRHRQNGGRYIGLLVEGGALPPELRMRPAPSA